MSCSHHRGALICDFSAPQNDKSRKTWVSDPNFLLSYVIYACNIQSRLPGPGVSNIMAALEQRNRVRKICMNGIPESLMKKFTAIRVPFPMLTGLELASTGEKPPVISDSFLSGSAPHLRISGCGAFHFRPCRNYFCLSLTLPIFTFWAFCIPGTFHLRRLPPAHVDEARITFLWIPIPSTSRR